MKVLIGSPVYKREWILPYWFEAIEKQNISLDRIGFIFETEADDRGTKDLLFDWHSKHPQVWCFDVKDNTEVEHIAHHPSGKRRWDRERYADMAVLRNSLLARARVLRPNYYFSLDTDILLEDPNTLTELIKTTSYADAVTTRMYMSPTRIVFPNVMTWSDHHYGRAFRADYPMGERFQADVIMAAKLMTPEVLNNVDYRLHRQGEDLGWSANCKTKGYKLYCASDIYTPHIMSENMLQTYLESGDERAKL